MEFRVNNGAEEPHMKKRKSAPTGTSGYSGSIALLSSLGHSFCESERSPKLCIFTLDLHQRLIQWNPIIARTLGYAKELMMGKQLHRDLAGIFVGNSLAILETAFNKMQESRGNSSTENVLLNVCKRNGEMVRLLSCCFPLNSMENTLNGMVVCAQDYTELSRIIRTIDGNHLQQQQQYQKTGSALAETPAFPSSEHGGQATAVHAHPGQQGNTNQTKSKVSGWTEINPTYVVESVLGQGSYGQVAKCRHVPTGEVVAIKRIQNVFADPIDAKRILRELCIVRQLKHPNLVQIRDIIRPPNINSFSDIFVVFEFLPSDLDKLLHSPQFLSAEHLRWLLLDLLKSLKYMHSAEIVHRDLKPANVLLNLSPVAIKICDFGLARNLSDNGNGRKVENDDDNSPKQKIQRQLTEHVVTRWYRAPEIIFREHNYSTKIDVWSVGCIFAELLSMEQSSVPSHYQREPLFPGVSCFPLSPSNNLNNQPALPQDNRDQLNTILNVLGTMSPDDIQEISNPDVRTYLSSLPPRVGKNFQSMYPGAEPNAIDLLTKMLQMNPRKRISVDEALQHEYLNNIRSLEKEFVAAGPIKLEFDMKKKELGIKEIRQLIKEEILYYHPNEEVDRKRVRAD